ncbi:MAG: aminotransferase class V-fold PLP-dependent enzyme [Candidatus Caldatribacteriaceae bacterium]
MGERKLTQEVVCKIKTALGTRNEVILWPGDRREALERISPGCFLPGETVLVPIMGEDSDEWAGIAERQGLEVIRLGSEWGETVFPEDIEFLMKSINGKTVKGVLLTLHETSTGVVADVEPIARTCRKRGMVCVVSAWDTLGMIELAMDRWNVDILISWMPGEICLATARKEHFARMAPGNKKADFEWPSLEAMEKTLKNSGFQKYRKMKKAIREGIQTMGLELLVKRDEIASPVFTTVRLPEKVNGDQIIDALGQKGVSGVNRLGRRESQIIRIDHRECRDLAQILSLCGVLGMSVSSQGIPLKIQEGINRAQEVYYSE